jgi:hypothetical protein
VNSSNALCGDIAGLQSSRLREKRRIALVLILVVVCGALLAAFHVGINRGFHDSIGTRAWGRVLFGAGAVITAMDHGGYGYTVSTVIETVLTYGGLTDDPKILADLGSKHPDNLRDSKLINAAFDKAVRFKWSFNPHEAVRGSGGDDIGFVDYVRMAFYLFGHRLQSLYFAYFLFFAISAAAFIATFRAQLEVLCLLAIACLAQVFLFASPLFDSARSSIADPRFLSVLAIVPGLHIACLMLWWSRLSRADLALAALQSVLLVFAFWIRASAIWVVLGLGLLASLIILKGLFERRVELARLSSFGILVGVMLGHMLYVSVALHPVYSQKGEIAHHVFWHAVFSQLESHPQWKTKYGPQFDNATGDMLPQVAAKNYLATHPSDDPSIYLTEDRTYLTVAAQEFYKRQAFFEFLRNDPDFVLETMFWYKLKRVSNVFLHYLVALASSPAIGQAAGCLVLLVLAGVLAVSGSAAYGRFAGGVLLLTGAFFVSLLPIILTIPALMIDQFYMLLIALAGWGVLILCGGLRACMRLIELWRAAVAMPAVEREARPFS